MDRLDLSSAVVVVTGASGGVGRAAARAFGGVGAKVALLARGREGLEHARAEIESVGGVAAVHIVDVADANAVAAAADAVVEQWGRIDIWVNVAMATVFSPVEKVTPKEFHRVTQVTYLGSVYGTMAALKHMRAQGHGTIVQVASALGYRGIPLQSAYCGSKFALRGFLQSLRCELRHDKSPVHIAEVQLSAFNTPQFDWARSHMEKRAQPLPPIFQPEVAARAVLWAATHRRREIWVGFPALKTILAARFAPVWLMDRILAKKGYSGQLTQDRDLPSRADNLFSPVAGDFGAHGRFDSRARAASRQLSLALHRAASITAGLCLLAAVVAIVWTAWG